MNSLQCFNRYYVWVLLLLSPLSQKGQSLVADIHPGNQGYDPSRLKIANNAFLFVANNPIGGEVLYRSDGTAGKTKAIVGGTQTTNGGKIWDFAALGDDFPSYIFSSLRPLHRMIAHRHRFQKHIHT